MVAYNKQINKALTNYKAKFCKQTNHLSMMMFCGFVGRGASFSMITLLFGGSRFLPKGFCFNLLFFSLKFKSIINLPEIVITFCGYEAGGAGGCSLTIKVSGWCGAEGTFISEIIKILLFRFD